MRWGFPKSQLTTERVVLKVVYGRSYGLKGREVSQKRMVRKNSFIHSTDVFEGSLMTVSAFSGEDREPSRTYS